MKPPFLVSSLGVLALASLASAQDPHTRQPFEVTRDLLPRTTACQVAAPAQSKIADRKKNLAHTARLVHAVYADVDDDGQRYLRHRRSIDGGWSWQEPSTIWRDTATDSFDDDFVLLANGHQVFVVLLANRDAKGNSQSADRDSIWVLASPDQGQTWQRMALSAGQPQRLQSGDQLDDIADVRAALSLGRVHILFLADYKIAMGKLGKPSSLQDVYATAVDFDAKDQLRLLFKEPTRLNTANGSGTVDCDMPFIAAEGGIVNASWQDNRVKPTTENANNVYSKTSLKNGDDWITAAEVLHTPFTAKQPAIRASAQQRAVVDFTNVYVVQRDSRSRNTEDVFLSINNKLGMAGNWSHGVKVNKTAVGSDRAGAWVGAERGKIFVIYDDREPSQNHQRTLSAVGHNVGFDFRKGQQVETRLGKLDSRILAFECMDDTLAVLLTNPSTAGSGLSVAASCNWGKEWSNSVLLPASKTKLGGAHLAVSQNRDLPTIYFEDTASSDPSRTYRCRVGGLRVPFIIDETNKVGGIMKTRCYGSIDEGDFVILVPSLTSPRSLALSLDDTNGILANFVPDQMSDFVISYMRFWVVGTVVNGAVDFPSLSFRASRAINQELYWMGVTATTQTLERKKSFTDPILQKIR